MQIFMTMLVVLAGLGLSLQAAMNTRLRTGVQSPVLSALISFVVGAIALAIVAWLGVFGRGKLTGLSALPWWAWLGGLMGAFYVTIAVIAVPRIGVGALIVSAVFGQLVAALALDTFGWLGVTRTPLNGTRILGAVFLLIGVLLMQRK